MQEFDYPEKKKNPKRHQKIVESLLQGVFITTTSDVYDTILTYQKWYQDFFNNTFSIELKHEYGVFYLTRLDNASSLTKRILTTLAIVMYELNNKGIEPVKAIREDAFKIDTVNSYITDSVQFSKFADKNRVDNTFINKIEKLGLVRRLDDDRFMFTEAIEVFLNEYDNIRYEVSAMSDGSIDLNQRL
jgi:hypothetical protein